MTVLRVLAWGVATSVRDAGRPGLAHLGRSRGGAVDLDAHRLGNRLVGNGGDATAFETSGGLTLLAERAVVVCVTGSPAELYVDGGPPLGWGIPVALPAGASIRIGRLRGGARTYLAVRGGVVSVDGDAVSIGPEPAVPPLGEAAVPPALDASVRLWPGPRVDWFDDGSFDLLVRATWTILPASDRVGLRLDGPALRRSVERELPSEGLVEGAVQVPPDGRPIVMLADHPTTGGYPVIAVVDPADLSIVAQRPPGSSLSFRRATPR